MFEVEILKAEKLKDEVVRRVYLGQNFELRKRELILKLQKPQFCMENEKF